MVVQVYYCPSVTFALVYFILNLPLSKLFFVQVYMYVDFCPRDSSNKNSFLTQGEFSPRRPCHTSLTYTSPSCRQVWPKNPLGLDQKTCYMGFLIKSKWIFNSQTCLTDPQLHERSRYRFWAS